MIRYVLGQAFVSAFLYATLYSATNLHPLLILAIASFAGPMVHFTLYAWDEY